jgi:DNA polymerase III delta subunit
VDNREPPFAIAKRLSIHPFVAQTTARQCKNFTEEQIKIIYQKMLKIDADSKTGGIKTTKKDKSEYELAIEKLIIECCNL